jgi:NTP pyrophosphatase (non-canonical NTP hydrolase)
MEKPEAKNYVESVLRTAPERTEIRLDKDSVDLLHGAMGIVTEAGELLDVLKKFIFYNKPVDFVNLLEEVGDLLWYVTFLSARLNINIEECMKMNSAKLKQRFPEKFNVEEAQVRDLEKERIVLESNTVSESVQNSQNNDSKNEIN